MPKIKAFADTVTKTWRTIPQDEGRDLQGRRAPPTTPSRKSDAPRTPTTPSRMSDERADDLSLAVRSPPASPVRFETGPFGSDGQLISVVDQLTQTNAELFRVQSTNAELTRHIVELSKDHTQAASKAHTEFANTMRVLAEGPMSHRERPKDR